MIAMCYYHETQFGRPDPECTKCQAAQREFEHE